MLFIDFHIVMVKAMERSIPLIIGINSFQLSPKINAKIPFQKG
jgi:hypothetical protein